MRRSTLQNLPPLQLPDDCHLRPANREDAEQLAALLTACFEDHWTPEMAAQRFFEDVTVQSTFLIEQNGEAIATASTQFLPDRPGSGVTHWVAASPAHSGKGLGRAICLAVLEDQRDRGCRDSFLTTDDHRLAAIKTYLNLGFEPVMSHDSHPHRWESILRTLNDPTQPSNPKPASSAS